LGKGYTEVTADHIQATERGDESGVLFAILAGGFGTRLGVVTARTPKALVRVRQKPLLQLTLEQLGDVSPPNRIVVMAAHFGEQVKSYVVHNGWAAKGVGVHIGEPKGTGHALRDAMALAEDFGHSQVITINADTIVHVNFDALLALHGEMGGLCTVAVTRRRDVQDPGRLLIGPGNEVVGVAEVGVRARLAEMVVYTGASTGVLAWSVDERSALVRNQGMTSMENDVLVAAIAKDRVYCYDNGISPCIDCGTPERLNAAQRLRAIVI
jgi:NDP-sugar pyrophosphorylase family protein